MYNQKSTKAEEFISHKEVIETIEYAENNKTNSNLIRNILEKLKNL